MRLYLEATSSKEIGYTPDWLKIHYKNNKEQNVEITFDIHGTIDYDNVGLNCRVKGDLIPWVAFYMDEGKDVDLSEIDSDLLEKQYSLSEIIEKRVLSSDIEIGIYPCMGGEDHNACEDTLSDGKGSLYYDNNKTFEFTFVTEFNGY